MTADEIFNQYGKKAHHGPREERERRHCPSCEAGGIQNAFSYMNFISTTNHGKKIKLGLYCPGCGHVILWNYEVKRKNTRFVET